jgi:hypothetical protein
MAIRLPIVGRPPGAAVVARRRTAQHRVAAHVRAAVTADTTCERASKVLTRTHSVAATTVQAGQRRQGGQLLLDIVNGTNT